MKLNKKNSSRETEVLTLCIDNCTAYNLTSTFNANQVQFLPPNATFIIQSLNQGIINNLNNFKIFYQKNRKNYIGYKL